MTTVLRDYRRNKRCRTALVVPDGNHHHVFRTPGGHSNSYHWRCRHAGSEGSLPTREKAPSRVLGLGTEAAR
jgi:hypothetical protein